MSDAWHEYEQGLLSGWLPALFLVALCVVGLIRTRRRISRVEVLFHAATAVSTVIACWSLAPFAVVLLVSGLPEALLGLLAAAPFVLAGALARVLIRKARAREF